MRRVLQSATPTWRYEQKAQKQGFARVAGIDEAGRGPLAGPVVAAAVVFAPGFRMEGLADSKQLSPEHRLELSRDIRKKALSVEIGKASAAEIDRLNILAATHLAAQRAVEGMSVAPDYLITDCLRLDWADVPVEPLVRGDQRCASVAAASIVAKVARDEIMGVYDEEYPGYGFAAHKGYGTAGHLDALRALGPTTIHRVTFRGVVWFDTQLRCSKMFQLLAEAVGTVEDTESARLTQGALRAAATHLPEREMTDLDVLFKSRLTALGIRLL